MRRIWRSREDAGQQNFIACRAEKPVSTAVQVLPSMPTFYFGYPHERPRAAYGKIAEQCSIASARLILARVGVSKLLAELRSTQVLIAGVTRTERNTNESIPHDRYCEELQCKCLEPPHPAPVVDIPLLKHRSAIVCTSPDTGASHIHPAIQVGALQTRLLWCHLLLKLRFGNACTGPDTGGLLVYTCNLVETLHRPFQDAHLLHVGGL